jgi:ribosomal protein S12 methylthiotransferase accessory factor
VRRSDDVRRVRRLLDPAAGLVRAYWNVPPYHDEPKLYNIMCEIDLPDEARRLGEKLGEDFSQTGGASLAEGRALWKALGEAVERSALIDSAELGATVRCPARDLDGEHVPFDDILLDESIAPSKWEEVDLRWVRGVRLNDGTPTWIPAQLVFVPYVFGAHEPFLRCPITTGAAAGASLEQALLTGLAEAVERDAFMVTWLRQVDVFRFDPPTGTAGPHAALLRRTLAAMARYHLSPSFYLMPSDTPLLNVLCVLEDTTWVGPHVSTGTKASFDVVTSALGALEEAQQMRPWLRGLLEREPDLHEREWLDVATNTLEDRARVSLSRTARALLKDWLVDAPRLGQLPAARQMSLRCLVEHLDAKGLTLYAVDLTSERARDAGLFVAKVIAPRLQPLYLVDDWKEHAIDRLASAEQRLGVHARRPVGDLVSFPHPYL